MPQLQHSPAMTRSGTSFAAAVNADPPKSPTTDQSGASALEEHLLGTTPSILTRAMAKMHLSQCTARYWACRYRREAEDKANIALLEKAARRERRAARCTAPTH
jgi:hypothetical protein